MTADPSVLSPETATAIARAVELYLLAGLVFGVVFAWRGAGRLDPVATHGTWGFRLLIVPGAMALWPLLLSRWLRGRRQPPDEANAHRRLAGGGEAGGGA